MFDAVDVIFDLPGYIAGYGVSPDSRSGAIGLFHGNNKKSSPKISNICLRSFADD